LDDAEVDALASAAVEPVATHPARGIQRKRVTIETNKISL
jgi:hypothetical protein